MAASLTGKARARGATDARSWLGTRPVEVELAAIGRAVELAGETKCALHVVHVSSPEGLELIAEARRRGVNVSAETCPHYLLLNEDDTLRLGAVAKCAPPLRSEERRQALWQAAVDGQVHTIGSDHSPAPPEMKQSKDFFSIWGGISGVQHGFPLLISEALTVLPSTRALPWLAGVLAANVARRFHLKGKGTIAEGHEADFTLLDLRQEKLLSNDALLYRHKQGPYDGRPCHCQVRQTWVRGRRIWHDGSIAPDAPRGHLLKPTP
jgi:allantoinase